MSFIPWFNKPRAFWGNSKDIRHRGVHVSQLAKCQLFIDFWDKLGYLETRVDVVAKLTAELVHIRSHCWTLGLNIPEGGDCQDAGGGNVSSDIFLC